MMFVPEDRKRELEKKLEQSKQTSKDAKISSDRMMRSLQELEDLLRDDRSQRGPDHKRG